MKITVHIMPGVARHYAMLAYDVVEKHKALLAEKDCTHPRNGIFGGWGWDDGTYKFNVHYRMWGTPEHARIHLDPAE